MPSQTPVAVAFDLDGTLVDSVGDLHALTVKLLAERGLPSVGIDTVRSFIGHGIPPLVEQSFAAVGAPLSPDALSVAVERYKVLYAAAPADHSRPYPGVVGALTALRTRGMRLAVCTNKIEALSRAVVDAVGLGAFFDAIVGGDTLSVRKPDPAMLRHTAQLLGAPTERLVFVGDSETDAATAEAAGVPLMLYTRGYRKSPVESLTHAAAFDDFAELPALMSRLA